MKESKSVYLLYLYIILSPIFDIFSSIFKFDTFSLSTILRPIIPTIILIYIFVTGKDKIKSLFIYAIYILYSIIHLLIYKGIIKGIAYGGYLHEMQYLLNYTFLILLLYVFYKYFYKKDAEILKKGIFYISCFYIVTIYISIITNTSAYTYIEKVGFKGYFNTGGQVSSILSISLFVLIPYLLEKKNTLLNLLFISSTLFYLSFLIGTRTGLYGSILLITCYIISIIIVSLIRKFKISKKMLLTSVSLLIGTVLIISVFGSQSIKRREKLDKMEDDKIHIAYDLYDIRNNIIEKKTDSNYMDNYQIKALESLYDYANKTKLPNVDLRSQQLIYNYYLYKYENNIMLKLFGNGYLRNFGALTLEMEYPALIFNFGIIGFVLYGCIFIYILIYGLYYGIRNYRKIDIEYMMYTFGILMTFFVSSFAGHTYFNTSVMIIIVLLNILYLNKIREIRE